MDCLDQCRQFASREGVIGDERGHQVGGHFEGYRPGRSAIDAVRTARQRCWRYDWVLDIDIKAFFEASTMRCSCVRSGDIPAARGCCSTWSAG